MQNKTALFLGFKGFVLHPFQSSPVMRMKRSWRQMIQPENQPDSLTSKQKDILWLADTHTHTHRTDIYNTVKAALKVCKCLEYAWPLIVLCRQ